MYSMDLADFNKPVMTLTKSHIYKVIVHTCKGNDIRYDLA